MSDEEQTAENGRFSCVLAKGFAAICNFLISVSTECFSGSCVAVIFLQQKMLPGVLSHVSPAHGTLLLTLMCTISGVLPYHDSNIRAF